MDNKVPPFVTCKVEYYLANSFAAVHSSGRIVTIKPSEIWSYYEKTFTGCERPEIWSGDFLTSLHFTLPEPRPGKNPTPERYVGITDLSPLGQINKSKKKPLTNIMAYEEIFERLTVDI